MQVNQSGTRTWRKCRQAYAFKYIEKIVPRRIARPFMFGRMMHKLIERWSNGDDNPLAYLTELEKSQGKMFKQERELYGNILDDTRVIFTEYLLYHGEDSLVPVRFKGKAAEHTFNIEIMRGITWKGTLDNIATTPKKKGRFLVEHKTFKTMPHEDHRWRSLQNSTYHRAVEMLGLTPLVGTCWDYIRSKPPAVPKFLKNGSLSRRGIDTLPTRVLDFLRDNKLDKKKFSHLLASAEKNRKEYFVRIFRPVKKKVVDLMFQDFLQTAKEIAENHNRPSAITMNIDRHCDWCEYEKICRARLQGLDEDFIRRNEYEADTSETVEPDFEG